MRLSNLSILLFVCGALTACSSATTPSGTPQVTPEKDAGPDGNAAVVCCDIPSTPPSCSDERYGGVKTSPSDSCIDGFDGLIPDPLAPGWTKSKDAAGCAIWVAPPSAQKVQCGVAPPVDAGADAADAGDGGELDAVAPLHDSGLSDAEAAADGKAD